MILEESKKKKKTDRNPQDSESDDESTDKTPQLKPQDIQGLQAQQDDIDDDPEAVKSIRLYPFHLGFRC